MNGLRFTLERIKDLADGDVSAPLLAPYRVEILNVARAALAAPVAGLDAAWAAAEAALPGDDWDMAVYRLGREARLRESRRLYAATASSPHDPVTRSWSLVSSEEGRDRDEKQDTTPAAALLALAARLADRTPEAE